MNIHKGNFPPALMVDFQFSGVYEVNFTWEKLIESYGEDHYGSTVEIPDVAKEAGRNYVSSGRALEDGIPKLLAEHSLDGVEHLADFQVVRNHMLIENKTPFNEDYQDFDFSKEAFQVSVDVTLSAVGYQKREIK